MRALLDTCVIIDGLQTREPFCKAAQAVFLAAANNQFAGCITAKAATDVYYLMRRHTHDEAAARAVLGKLFALFDVLDAAGSDCRRAIPSAMPDYENAVMAETALRAEVSCIITRNLGDYRRSPLPVFAPEEFLKRLKSLTDR